MKRWEFAKLLRNSLEAVEGWNEKQGAESNLESSYDGERWSPTLPDWSGRFYRRVDLPPQYRPFTPDEFPDLVNRVVRMKGEKHGGTIRYYSDSFVWIDLSDRPWFWVTAPQLLDHCELRVPGAWVPAGVKIEAGERGREAGGV